MKRLKPKTWYIGFFLLIFFLALLNFNLALNFHFMYDDWGNLFYMVTKNSSGYVGQFDVHPGNYLTFLPLVPLFGVNPIPYNYFGLIVKIVIALCVGVFSATLLKDKKYFFIASIFYASYFGSEETYLFTTARNNALNIAAVCFSFTFFIKSYLNKDRKFFLGFIIALFLGFFADPARMMVIPPLLILWEFIERWQNKKLKQRDFLVRIGLVLIVSLVGILSTPLGRSIILPDANSPRGHIAQTLFSSEYYVNYFLGVGYLITSYFNIPLGIDQYFKTLIANTENIGKVFIALMWLVSIWRFFKKSSDSAFWFIVSIGIPVSLLLNWLAFPYIIAKAEHRYQAISSVFFVVLITYLLGKLRTKARVIALICFVILNLFINTRYIWNLNGIRAFERVEDYYVTQYSEIPPNAHPGIFILSGNSRMLSEQVYWASGGTVPYAFRKGIVDLNQMPSFAPDYDVGSKILCNELGKRPVVGEWIKQEKKISIDEVYGWEMDDRDFMRNTTDKARIKLAVLSSCLSKIQNLNVIDGLDLKATSYLPTIYTADKSGAGFLFNLSNNKPLDSLKISIELLDNGNLLETEKKDFLFKPMKEKLEKIDIEVIQNNSSKDVPTAKITVEACEKGCDANLNPPNMKTVYVQL